MSLDTRQQDLPLGVNPQACFKDIADPGTPHPELGKLYAAELQPRCLQPPLFQSLLFNHDKESFGKRFSRVEMRSWCAAAATTTPHGALESSQKRLVIFDQSGDQTHLLRFPFPIRFPSPVAAEPVKFSELHSLEKTFKEEFDENHLNGKESEMHEDTDEINALLYSDDDYDDNDDDDDDDDEVMSTGHSPYQIEQVCNKRELDEIDGPSKRRKLMDNVDKISDSSSLGGIKSSTKLNGSSLNIPESKVSTKEDTSSGLSNEQSRKDKIRTALKILESVVPGAKGNEALLLLDEAIDYLKFLKQDIISNHLLNKNIHHGEQEI